MNVKEQINQDILKAAKEAGFSVDMYIKMVAALLPRSFDFQCDCEVPVIVKAWTALQVEIGSPLRYCNIKYLGEFIYNSDMYYVCPSSHYGYNLHYKQDSGLHPEIPIGLKSCHELFKDCKLPKGFTLSDNFDTSDIIDMSNMFDNCELPEGFTLGPNFNTSNVKDMSFMFNHCKLPIGFTLGNNFNTSKVTDMRFMFQECAMSEGFSLGVKFDISSVKNMDRMFENCKLNDQPIEGTPEEIIAQLKD